MQSKGNAARPAATSANLCTKPRAVQSPGSVSGSYSCHRSCHFVVLLSLQWKEVRSAACVATRDVKHSTSCRAHTYGLRGIGKSLPWDSDPMWDLHPWRGPELPFQTLLFSLFPWLFLISPIISGYRCGEGTAPCPTPAPPAEAHGNPCKADLGLLLEETCSSADAHNQHPACSRLHATRGLSCPCACNLE